MPHHLRYAVGEVISWPTLSERCILVDEIEWQALLADETVVPPDGLPPHRAVVFEVLKNGDALAAYNGRFSAEQLQSNPFLPVLWLRTQWDLL